MLLKIFGVIDLGIAIFFALNLFDKWGIFPDKIILIAGIYLLIKGILFAIILDFASVIDIICAIIMLLSLSFSIAPLISAFVIIFLAQKAFFSIVA